MNKTRYITTISFVFLLSCESNQEPVEEGIQDYPATISNQIAADLVLSNGQVYTQDTNQPWVESVAVSNGKIVYVGNNAGAQDYIGDNTNAVDLAGKLAMPGLIDAHVHSAWGGVKDLFQCNFPFSATPDDIAEKIAQCVEAQPDAVWIQGGQWTSNFFLNNDIGSPRLFLDKVSGDKAVLLRDDSGHNMWVNTRALELAGVDADSEDPPGGYFERESGSNQPNGVVVEAYKVILDAVPEWTVEQYMEGARYAVERANEYGVTGFKDASASETEADAFYKLDQEQGVTVHAAMSLYDPDLGENFVNINTLVEMRDKYASTNVHTNFIKIFLDGVPTASRTAAMLKPYLPVNPEDEPVFGPLHLDPSVLNATVTALDKEGFMIKIHTAGDRAVRVALDAIEIARKTNGNNGHRHELAHAEYIDASDIPRFAELNVAADFSPYIFYLSPIFDSIIDAVGERAYDAWPSRDLLENNGDIIAGSDWPSAVPDMNPWMGIEALVTRSDPMHRYDREKLWEGQALTIEEVIEIYTRKNAEALNMADKTGSIEVGKLADIIVLNHNIFEIPPEQLSDTTVNRTYFGGNLVYSGDN